MGYGKVDKRLFRQIERKKENFTIIAQQKAIERQINSSLVFYQMALYTSPLNYWTNDFKSVILVKSFDGKTCEIRQEARR